MDDQRRDDQMTDDQVLADDQLLTDDRVTDDRVTDDQVTDDRVTDDQVTDDRVTDDQVTDDQVTDDQVTDDQVTDDQVTDDRVTDDRVTDDRVLDDRVLDDEDATVTGAERVGDGQQAGPETTQATGARLLDGGDDWAGRWNEIQIRFVDEPRRSIEDADALVDEVIKELMARFDDERQHLERQWSAGSEPSTEDLRLALQRYRAFFDRLLAA